MIFVPGYNGTLENPDAIDQTVFERLIADGDMAFSQDGIGALHVHDNHGNDLTEDAKGLKNVTYITCSIDVT
jgi:hypothetical protein